MFLDGSPFLHFSGTLQSDTTGRKGDMDFGVTGLVLSPLLDHLWAVELALQPHAHQVMEKAEV